MEPVMHFAHFEGADNVSFFFDDPLGEIAFQELTDIDSDGVTVSQRRVRTHGRVADHDRPIGFQHFKAADAFVVIAGNF